MIAPAARRQLLATTLLFAAAALFAMTAMQLSRLAEGWTLRGIWTATLGLFAMAAAIGPWLWAQTVRTQRFLLAAILVGSGGGLLALLPGMGYLMVAGAQAALVALIVTETRAPR